MGYNDDAAAHAERLDPRQRVQGARPDRRRVRDRAGDEAAQAGVSRSTRACTAARRPSRRRRSPSAAPATRTTSRRWRWSAATPIAAVLAGDGVGEVAAGPADGGHADVGDADEGVPGADRADQRRGPGAAGRAGAEHATRSTEAADARPRARDVSGARGPLHGIPVLLDDAIDVTRPADHGAARSRCRSRCRAPTRRWSRKLKAAGAIVLGKTNVVRAQRPVRREHARGLLVARRPGAAAVRHRQDARRARRPVPPRRPRRAWRR